MINIKRVYERPEKSDGLRVLVDRLWPRGLRREDAKIDIWMRDIAPSDSLRKWFGHKEERWEEFRERYIEELEDKKELIRQLKDLAKKQTVTLLYAAKDIERNNAVVLLEFLSSYC